jgi:hypothetical protein
MNIIIDLDLQQAVQGFGSRQPALPIQVKSQDTPTVALYFVRGNVTYDLGASPGLRFGVYVAGNPNPLVQQNTFTRTADNLARTVYVAYPNFNTTAMLAAIGSQPQLSCIGEIRYQTTYGTIARTADIDFTVVRSLLNETVMANLIAAFITPAVNANVTARINNTGWLSAGLNISIAAGAGAYQVVSVTNVTDFLAKNLGGASNAASGTTIPSGTAVGIAPVNVLQAYPDPSIIEVTTHKDVINGYAGLDGTGLLKGAEMPVDAKTIAVSGGKLASSAILTTTAANFTTPAVSATVSVTLVSTSGLVAGQYVRIPNAGYYVVTSITDATHAVLTNNGDPFNAGSGVTITSGAVLLPAQAASGGGGGGGGGGVGVSAKTTAAFNWPAANATVTVSLDSGWNAFANANNDILVYVGPSFGILQMTVASSNPVTLKHNPQYFTGTASGTSIPSGTVITLVGVQVYDSAATSGATLVTDATASDTPFLPAIKRIIATDNSITLDSATSDLAIGLKASVTLNLNAHIETPTAKTYAVDLSAATAYTILKLTIVLGAGTITAAFKKNGTVITGISAVAVTATLQTITLSQAVAQNDSITMTLSAPSSAADLQYSLRYQK